MKIFLSHSHDDDALANFIRDGLEARVPGLEVARLDVHPGHSISEAISDALLEADVLVALVSRNSERSQWANLEVAVALSAGKPVIPVLREADAAPPLLLKDRFYIDFSDPKLRTEGLETLARTLTAPVDRRVQGDKANLSRAVATSEEALMRERALYELEMAHMEFVERRMRLYVAVVVVLMAVAGTVTLAVAGKSTISAVLPPVITLVASVLGFFFGAVRSRRTGSDEH